MSTEVGRISEEIYTKLSATYLAGAAEMVRLMGCNYAETDVMLTCDSRGNSYIMVPGTEISRKELARLQWAGQKAVDKLLDPSLKRRLCQLRTASFERFGPAAPTAEGKIVLKHNPRDPDVNFFQQDHDAIPASITAKFSARLSAVKQLAERMFAERMEKGHDAMMT